MMTCVEKEGVDSIYVREEKSDLLDRSWLGSPLLAFGLLWRVFAACRSSKRSTCVCVFVRL